MRPVTGRVPAGALLHIRGDDLPVNKPFLSYTQQLDKLENEKNLIISDRQYAETVLKRISYFALVSGYKSLLINPTTRKYKDGTTFEEIVALYNFDESLRGLFLRYLLKIEQTMRSLISYNFSELHGNQQQKYLTPLNYDQSRRKTVDLTNLIALLSRLALRSTEYSYITYQRNTYGNVPIWVLVKVLTFGSISKLYYCFPQHLQVKISKNFDGVNEKQLVQYLRVLTIFRNVCAHNDRLFSYTAKDDIPDTLLHTKLMIAKKGSQYVYGKRGLFSVVIAFRYLLQKDDFRAFKDALGKIIDRFVVNTTHVSNNELLHEMGFPINWKKISSFKV